MLTLSRLSHGSLGYSEAQGCERVNYHPHAHAPARRDSRKMRHPIEPAPVEQAVRIRVVTRCTCRPISAWRVAGWRMGVDDSVRASRASLRGVLATSDNGQSVNQ